MHVVNSVNNVDVCYLNHWNLLSDKVLWISIFIIMHQCLLDINCI